jgi:hypothetical protein
MGIASALVARRAARDAEDRSARWRFARAVARVHVVDDVLAEYATSYCGRPFRRRDVGPMESAVQLPSVTWSIEDDVMVEFLPGDNGPGRLVVHEIALLEPLRQVLRTRHVAIEYAAR